MVQEPGVGAIGGGDPPWWAAALAGELVEGARDVSRAEAGERCHRHPRIGHGRHGVVAVNVHVAQQAGEVLADQAYPQRPRRVRVAEHEDEVRDGGQHHALVDEPVRCVHRVPVDGERHPAHWLYVQAGRRDDDVGGELAAVFEQHAVLEADIIVTATGLNLLPMGGISFSVDGEAVDLAAATVYKSMMLSDVPNFAFAIGYTNASWTLKVDLVCEHLCRLLAYMDERDADMVVPVRSGGEIERLPLLDLTSGYVLRGVERFPHAGDRGPWTAAHAYERDVERLRDGPVEGPELHFRTRVSPPATTAVAA